MTNADQFESVFRAAVRDPFRYEPPTIDRLLLLSDLDEAGTSELETRVRGFLSGLLERSNFECMVRRLDEQDTVEGVLRAVEAEGPDLICTYRNLKTAAWAFPHTLGDYLEVLTNLSSAPVLVLPHPRAGHAADHALEDRGAVMAITDHLSGDHALVSWAARCTAPEGCLVLAHIEDEITFERYMEEIGKIPEIDTDLARETIRARLLRTPERFVESCREVIEQDPGLDIRVETIVDFGHHVRDHERAIEEREVDLLVFHSKDEDHSAMHGRAHTLAVHLRTIPLLML